MTYVNAIPELDGNNYGKWYQKLEIALAMANIDLAITTPAPQEPEKPVRAQNEEAAAWAIREKNYDSAMTRYDADKTRWNDSNRKCLMVMKGSTSDAIKMAIPDCDTASEYLAKVKSQFTGSSKAYAAILAEQLITKKYTGGGIREHILEMSHMANKLKTMDMPLPEKFIVQLVFKSLPKAFEAFHVNYNAFPEDWGIDKLIGMCVQEEDRLKNSNGGELAFQVQHKKKNFQNKNFQHNKRPFPPGKNQHESGPSRPPPQKDWENFPVEQDQCLKCKKRGHYKRDCPEFLKELLRKGEDTITFVDESLYLSYDKSTWWIDSGATTHVANSLQGSSMRRTLPRGARRIKVANGVEAEVEAIAEFHLELHSGFVLYLRDVLYVPSLQRNLISMSKLDDDTIACHFGDGKCKIQVNSECVGLAFRQDKLYLLSLSENVNAVCSENKNASSYENVTKKRKRIDAISSKLWHCRLGHISRGRIEHLVTASILPPLEFSDLEQCIDCIKGKFVKNIKKGAKRSAGILEIIHTDIC